MGVMLEEQILEKLDSVDHKLGQIIKNNRSFLEVQCDLRKTIDSYEKTLVEQYVKCFDSLSDEEVIDSFRDFKIGFRFSRLLKKFGKSDVVNRWKRLKKQAKVRGVIR